MTQDNCTNSGLTFWSDQNADIDSFDVDIIAVQGLGAHPFYTWVKKITDVRETEKTRSRWLGGKKSSKKTNDGESVSQQVMWPRDLLVPEFTRARVATYSYESDWRNRHVNTSLRECGQQLLEVLIQHRQCAKERQRPLILIGHSLGGLVVQQALVIAVHGSMYIDMRMSIAGIIFLGTPFQGSDAAEYGKKLAKLIRLPNEDKYTLLETLQKDNQELYNLAIDFWNSYNTHDMTCFYENKEAQYGPVKSQFVERQSATIIGKKMMSMNADHSGLNKFYGKDDPNFGLLLLELRRMVEMGPSLVKGRLPSKTAEVTVNVHWIVPRPLNSLFTGRAELVSRIQGALRDGDESITKRKQLVIWGLGGLGKSELCLQIANTMREEYWAVFWVDVSSLFTAENGFSRIAKALGAPADTIEDALLALSNTKKRWLLILDNADDWEIDYQRYLPSGVTGTVIMTSRIPECSRHSTVLAEEIGPLDEEHSKQLLLRAAQVPEQQWQFYDEPAQVIVGLLGSHTLALIQAGSYISRGYCRLAELPEKLPQQFRRFLEHYPRQAQSRYRHVYATFEASIDAINSEQGGRDALNLLGILAMFHHSTFPLSAFEDAWIQASGLRSLKHPPAVADWDEVGVLDSWHVSQLPKFMDEQAEEWDDYRLKKACDLLASLSLVNPIYIEDMEIDCLSMHPLSHAWARERLQDEWKKKNWLSAGCVLSFMQQSNWWYYYDREIKPHIQSFLIFKVDRVLKFGQKKQILPILYWYGWALYHKQDYVRLGALLTSIYETLQITPQEPSKGHVQIWYLASKYASRLGRHEQAVKLLTHKLETVRALIPETGVLKLLDELAGAYIDNKQINAAVDLMEQAVKDRELLIESHPDRLSSQQMLANRYLFSGQTKEAVDVLEHVVKVKESLQETDTSRLASMHLLGAAYLRAKQVKQAIQLLENVVKLREGVHEIGDRDLLMSQKELAAAYYESGQINEAVGLLNHVLRIRKKVLTETNPELLETANLLSHAYASNGQIQEAMELQEEVVKTLEWFPETHTDRLTWQYELADLYYSNGRIKEAIGLLEHVLQVREKTLVETDVVRLNAQHHLARAYIANGQLEEAVKLLENVVHVQKKISVETDRSLLGVQHELGSVYITIKRTEKAIALLEHVVKAQASILPETHRSRLASQHQLARAYILGGSDDMAIRLLEHVIQVRERQVDASDPELLTSQHVLAKAYRFNGQLMESIAVWEHVIAVECQVGQTDQLWRSRAQYTLGKAYLANSQAGEAKALLEHVVRILESILSKTDPYLRRSQRTLARAYYANGEQKKATNLLRYVASMQGQGPPLYDE